MVFVPGLSSIPEAVCLQHRDQRISKIISGNWDCYQIQSRLEVTSVHAGNRWWQILTSRPRETVNQHTTTFFRRDVQGGSNAYSWLVTALHSWSRGPGDACVRTFFWKNSDSEGDASKVEAQKMEAQYSYWLPQIPKEIYSTNRRNWWLENSRGQKWISEQSPVRCRGARSHHSVDTTREKPKLHRRRRRIL